MRSGHFKSLVSDIVRHVSVGSFGVGTGIELLLLLLKSCKILDYHGLYDGYLINVDEIYPVKDMVMNNHLQNNSWDMLHVRLTFFEGAAGPVINTFTT